MIFVRKAASGVAPCTIARVRGSRGALRLVDGSQPSLAQRVRKAPAMVVRRPLFVGTTRLVSFPDIQRFPDQRGSNDGMRDGPGTRPDGRFRR
jgi:hypothetical protein